MKNQTYVDELVSLDKLNEYLPKVDIVATVLPGTKATYQIFDKEKFALMKKVPSLLMQVVEVL